MGCDLCGKKIEHSDSGVILGQYCSICGNCHSEIIRYITGIVSKAVKQQDIAIKTLSSCEPHCKNLEYTNPYANSYKCLDCGRIFIMKGRRG